MATPETLAEIERDARAFVMKDFVKPWLDGMVLAGATLEETLHGLCEIEGLFRLAFELDCEFRLAVADDPSD